MAPNKPSLALFTDLYELTMAQAYWQSGETAQATFSLYIRSYPPDRGYFVLGGIQDALDYLKDLRFSEEETRYLRSLDLFDPGFLEFLLGLRFTGTVRAMDEGAIFFANEPVIEVTAPIIEAQIAETYLLNQVNLQSVLATKAARVVHAARGRPVVDFAARRAHGADTANKFARVSYMAGFTGTSNVLAGKLYEIPVFGTMAHSFVEAFPREEQALRAYAESFPDSSTFLVDTYDTLKGVRKAVPLAVEMRRRGHPLRAVRIDSGDLLDLSTRARAILNDAGLQDVEVFASGGLDEFAVGELLRAGAPISGFGVGTKVGVSADAPWTDCVYKLVEYRGLPTLKLSTGKRSLPGPKQVFRYRDQSGDYLRDVIGLAIEPPPDRDGEPLLKDVMRGGRLTNQHPPLEELRERFARDFAHLPETHKALRSPATYDVRYSQGLTDLQATAEAEIRERELGQ
jgi:nicotinate phosphoribosyltransferase